MDSIFKILEEVVGGEVKKTRKVAESDVGTSWIINVGNTTVFVKCSRDEGDYANEGAVYFRNEHTFYTKITEHFSSLGIPVTSTAGCMCAGDNFFALEDLMAEGYKSLDVKETLSLDCVKLVVKNLGAFHAYSFAMKERLYEEFKSAVGSLEETVFTLEKQKLFIFAIHDALKLVKQSLPKDSIYVEKLSLFTLNIFEKLTELAKGDVDEYHVITHGDLWPNNVLISEDRVKFVDFNACRLASPVHDLMLIILLGLDGRTRMESRDELFVIYHNSLCEKLRELRCDPVMVFPFSALQKQLREHTKFALATALVGLPLLMDEGGALQMEDGGDPLLSFIQKIHARKSMKCKNKIIEIVMDVIDHGYLD